MLTRRALIAAAGGPVLGAVVGPVASRAQDSAPPPLIFGVLTDTTGIGASVSGLPLVQAVRQAVEDTGDLPYYQSVSMVTESYQLRPVDAVAIAQRWFDQGVAAIIDVPDAGAALAVQELAQSRGRSYLATGNLSPDLTGRRCSPLGTSWGVDSVSMTTALAVTMARSGTETWFLVAPDTTLGSAVQDDATRAIEAAGGRVVGQSVHPEEMSDFASIGRRAKASGAQAIGLCDMTTDLSNQLGQFQNGGLFADGQKVVAFLPAITSIHAAGAKAAQGLVLASSFYWDQNDQTRSFAKRFFAATQQMPDAAHAAAYVAVRHYLSAVVTLDSRNAVQINAEMRRSPVYVFGSSARLRIDGRLIIDLGLYRVKPPEAMLDDWGHYEEIGTIPATDVYRPLSETGCVLPR